jgi:choline kinase
MKAVILAAGRGTRMGALTDKFGAILDLRFIARQKILPATHLPF